MKDKSSKKENIQEIGPDDGAGDAPAATLGTLLRVLHFSTFVDRTIQVASVLAALITGAAMPLMALILGRLTANITGFDGASSTETSGQFMKQISKNALWFVYLFIVKFVLVYLWGLGFTFAANRTVQAIRLKCLDEILHRSVTYHDKQTPGSLSATITIHCNAIQTVLADRTGILIQAFSSLISAFAVAFSQSWQLTLVMLGVVIITGALMGFIGASDQMLEASLMQQYTECSLIAEDALGSIKTVVAFGATNKFLAKYQRALAKAMKTGKKKGPFVGMMFATQYFFMFISCAIGFWFGAWLYSSGRISDPGRIIAVFFSVLIGLGGTMSLGPNMPLFMKAIAASGAVFNLLDNLDNKDDDPVQAGKPGLSPSNGQLKLNNLSFSYHSDRTVLSEINVTFSKGTSTAIIGPSGAGKSTLIALLERWLEPTSGTMLLDDQDTTQLNVKWLRSQIALVQQEPQLFNASIFDNIARGLSGTKFADAPDSEKMMMVENVCHQARVTEFIEKLPLGIYTKVGNQGSLLSGGQKQRIAIARALIGQRPILLMDEPTSALDAENAKVIDSLITCSSDRTTIFVSHKIRSAMQADRIVVMNMGKVVQQGTHKELVSSEGMYKTLFEMQTSLGSTKSLVAPTHQPIAGKATMLMDAAASDDAFIAHKELGTSERRGLFVNLWEIAQENKQFWLIFAIGVFACLGTAQPFPSLGIILGHVLKTFQGLRSNVPSEANFWASMFLVIGFGALISYAIMGFVMTLLGYQVLSFYRFEYFRAVLFQRMEFFDQTPPSTLISRLTTDPTNLQELIGVNMGLLLSMGMQIITSAIIALAFSWKFALVCIFAAQPVTFAAGFMRFKLDNTLAEATTKIFEDSADFALDALSAVRTVKAFTLEATIQKSYENHLLHSIKALYRKTASIMVFFALSESVELLALALSFWYGGTLLSSGELNTTSFFIVFIAVVFGGQAAGAIFGFTSNVSKAKIAADNILSMRRNVPNLEEILNRDTEPKDTEIAVQFSDVSFAYPARPNVPVLSGISLQVSNGQTLGIVGSSGSGKSTLLALIERFYDVQSGVLNVLGAPISCHGLESYRKRLAYVSQEPWMYRGSIRDNILLGVEEDMVSDEDLAHVCDAANLTELTASLPEGIDSDCGTGGGVALSGGQKQRVAIARALIRNPDILLLDEPTSALDAESERMVQETLQNINAKRTIIIVTHRLNTIRHADIIFVMSAGQIVEKGTHDELLALRGHYFGMIQESKED